LLRVGRSRTEPGRPAGVLVTERKREHGVAEVVERKDVEPAVADERVPRPHRPHVLALPTAPSPPPTNRGLVPPVERFWPSPTPRNPTPYGPTHRRGFVRRCAYLLPKPRPCAGRRLHSAGPTRPTSHLRGGTKKRSASHGNHPAPGREDPMYSEDTSRDELDRSVCETGLPDAHLCNAGAETPFGLDEDCPDCRASAGVECDWSCSSNWN